MQNIISHKKILITIFLLSLALRVSAAFFYLNFDKHALTLDRRPFVSGPYDTWNVLGDRDGYSSIARNIAATGSIGGSEGAIMHPPLYSYFLAFFYKLFGFNVYSLLLPQIILDALNSTLIFLLALNIFNSRKIALFSGMFYAFNPHFILLSIQLYSETLYFFLMLAAFLLLIGFSYKPKLKTLFISAMFMGLAALTRSILLVFVPFVFIWLAIVLFKDKNKLFKSWLVVFISLSLVIAPWVARNYRLFHKVLFSTDYQLVVAKGVYNFYPEFKTYALGYEDAGEVFLNWVKENPAKYYKACLERLKIFLFKPYPFDVSLRNRIVSSVIFYLIFPLGIFGLILSLKSCNKPALLIFLFILSVSVTHILTDLDGELRYRIPIEMVLAPFAFYGLKTILSLKGRHLRQPAAS